MSAKRRLIEYLESFRNEKELKDEQFKTEDY